jgi:hypothetical protein
MQSPSANRGWIWYFAIVAILTVVATSILIWFNLSQQLKPEQLEQARALWERHGPMDYDMEYIEKGSVSETRKVQVRHGKVVFATRDGSPLEERLYKYSDMPALFNFLEDYLREDAKPGSPRTFQTATFDERDGHLIRFVRRVAGTTQRIEIEVQLQASAPGPSRQAGPSGLPTKK